MNNNNDYIIEAKGICKYFGAVKALENVDFEVKRGEILGIVGDNGAGKSTLIKIISGAITPNSGTIKFNGKTVNIRNPRDASNLGVETIYQDLALFENLDFAKNIFGGREYKVKNFGKIFSIADDRRMRNEAINKIKDISINLPNLNQKVGSMSGGQRQAVAITRAIFWGRKIIIMDEPTAALGVQESSKVLTLIKEIVKHLEGVVLITHNIEHIITVADRVMVLRNGEKVNTINCHDYLGQHDKLHNEIVENITGKINQDLNLN